MSSRPFDADREACRLYVGRISSRTRTRDLEDLFAKYGKVRDVDMKTDFAFVEYYDPRDADDARHYCNGKEFDGSRMVVEFTRRSMKGPSAPRGAAMASRGPPPGTGKCYNCGKEGHWARDCPNGDWSNKCYRCGARGHIERNCRESPRARFSRRSRTRSYSRSRSRSYSPRRSKSRSQSRSRSPVRERTRRDSRERETRRRDVGDDAEVDKKRDEYADKKRESHVEKSREDYVEKREDYVEKRREDDPSVGDRGRGRSIEKDEDSGSDGSGEDSRGH